MKFIDHIPDVGFKMIRYYGFLSNRLRSTLLPKIRKLLGQEEKIISTQSPSFAQLIFKDFGGWLKTTEHLLNF